MKTINETTDTGTTGGKECSLNEKSKRWRLAFLAPSEKAGQYITGVSEKQERAEGRALEWPGQRASGRDQQPLGSMTRSNYVPRHRTDLQLRQWAADVDPLVPTQTLVHDRIAARSARQSKVRNQRINQRAAGVRTPAAVAAWMTANSSRRPRLCGSDDGASAKVTGNEGASTNGDEGALPFSM